jgi:hypothetical protein
MGLAYLQRCRQRPPESNPERRLTSLENIICSFLHEAYKQQVEGIMDILSKVPEGLYSHP